MPEIIFHHPYMSILLLLVPVFILVFRLRLKRQRLDMALFGAGSGSSSRNSEHVSLEPWRLALLVLAAVLIIAALTRPAINPQPKMIPREGRDVVFLLDVSRSMLAEDRLPNRVVSAKSAIAECVESLDDHRVGLVVFAGSSSIICPLTMDKSFFLNSLEKAGPDSVAHGGTRIGDALLKVCDKLFSSTDHGYKDIVLLTDGGGQSKDLGVAIDELNAKQVRLISIGLGDQKQGTRIPAQNPETEKSDYVTYKNQEVWSRLEGAQLSRMVKGCDQGAYLPVGTRQLHLGSIYHRLSEQGGTQQLAEESVISYDEIFQWFIALALLLLCLMALTPHTWKRALKSKSTSSLLPVLLFLLAISPQLSATEDAHREYREGNTQYRAGKFSEAASSYEAALAHSPSAVLIRDLTYNLGNAYFKGSEAAENSYESLSLINQSITMYRRVLLQNKNDQDAAVNNELARMKRRDLEASIKEEEKRRQELQTALDQIREKLILLIAQQRSNLLQRNESEDHAPDQWGENEQLIADGTDQVTSQVNELNEKFFKGIPRDLTPVAGTKKHLATAFLHQRESILIFANQWPEALEKGKASLRSLKDALAALPQEPEGDDQSSDKNDDREEGDESEDSEQGEEGEEGDSESDDGEPGEQDSAQATKMDLKSIELPPPNNSPQDVIRMSQELQEARQSDGAKRKGKPVEKDW